LRDDDKRPEESEQSKSGFLPPRFYAETNPNSALVSVWNWLPGLLLLLLLLRDDLVERQIHPSGGRDPVDRRA
jgi:hypothetical protein